MFFLILLHVSIDGNWFKENVENDTREVSFKWHLC